MARLRQWWPAAALETRRKGMYYLGVDRTPMAVDIRTAPHFQSGLPKAFFRIPGMQSGISGFRYDAHADGKGFVAITQTETAVSAPTAMIIKLAGGVRSLLTRMFSHRSARDDENRSRLLRAERR